MKHRINGCPINLRTATRDELQTLIEDKADRIAREHDELASLVGEKIRRGLPHQADLQLIRAAQY